MPLNAEIETFVYRARQARPGLEDLETAANDLVARQTPSNSLIIARRMYELADPAGAVVACCWPPWCSDAGPPTTR